MRNPQRRKVVRLVGRVAEGEVRLDLQSVGRGRHHPPGSRSVRRCTARHTCLPLVHRRAAAAPAGEPDGSGARTAQDDDAAPVRLHLGVGLVLLGLDLLRGRVELGDPAVAVLLARQDERQHVVVAVEDHQEVVVERLLAAGVGLGDGLAVEEDHHRAGVAVGPGVLVHVVATGLEPGDVADRALATVVGRPGEEPAAAEDRVVAAQLDEPLRERDEVELVLVEVPVDPRDLVVLAVAVVVAALGAPELVAVQEHRHALREQEGREHVALLAQSQGVDLLVLRRTLDAAVPGAVVALAVVAVLAVGVVVLLVVGHQVPQREAVVGGDEVDRGDRLAAAVLVEVAGAGEARGELAEGRALATPEVADGVAVLAVPLGPQGREVADLVAAVADVPGLGDQLDLADHRVLLDEVEERRQLVDLVELAGQRRREVEPETVDVHLGHPVAQRVHDQLQHVRVAHQQAVAGARGVVVVRLVLVDEAVVGRVVDAAEADGRAELVALGGVVVDHVEDDLDARLVQRLDHALELGHLLTAGAVCRVAVVRREEPDRVVAPVVRQALVAQREVVDELVHRHELDGRDAEPLEVLDDHRVGDAGVGAADLLRDVGVGLGEALDVGFVDDAVVVLVPRQAVLAPVEEGVDDDREHRVAEAVLDVRLGRVLARARRSRRRTATGRRPAGRRSPWRRGRAAACGGCSGGRSRGRRGRARGSRSAARAGRRAGRRATRSRRPRAARRASRRRRRR